MQLYYLNLLKRSMPAATRVKTVAPDLDSALSTARRYLGAITLVSCGTRDLGLGVECLGGGRYLPSQFDRMLPPHMQRALLRDAKPESTLNYR